MSGHHGGLRRALAAMGTRFEVVIAGASEPLAAGAADEALARIGELHARWSRFEPASVLSGINRAACERPVRVEAETFALLSLAQELSRASGGAFDPTLTGRMHLVTLDHSERTVRFGAADLALDLGAIAKGAAIDAAAAVLREAGVPGALVHGGTSSVWAVGRDEAGEPWRVRLGPWAGAPVVVLDGQSLSVSAQHGDRPGHTVDPASGRSVARGGCCAVVVEAGADDGAARADAWATALLVRGELPAGVAGLAGWVVEPGGRVERTFGTASRYGVGPGPAPTGPTCITTGVPARESAT